MKILLLLNEEYRAASGIAQYNRNVADAIRTFGDAELRIVCRKPDRHSGVDKLAFAAQTLFHCTVWRPDLVFVGHINLVPLVVDTARRMNIPVALPAHGIEVWDAPNAARLAATRKVTEIWPVSGTTEERMRGWMPDVPMRLIHNCVELGDFTPGEKPAYLVDRYGLQGKRVVLTLARLPGKERYKGIDEMLLAMADLRDRRPDLHYLVAGEGPDKARLIAMSEELGIADCVTFAGFIDRAEKVDHYRLADAFAMPSRGEGFGIVFLEALACGIPVLGSVADGGRDALLDGKLGLLVDPGDRAAVAAGVEALLSTQAPPREALDIFAFPAFRAAVEHAIRSLVDARDKGSSD
ncbi:glycosyltransferase family 1 protein [Sphingopyxis sp. YF1]|uniref:glycosyltransferase family 4 protein n=1 Tax=Sphingopyxis sp. YF1 TaxID=2482763 RepID=UPI001F61602B|nr:glycosyltransferase family 4 protein [Sphingopyxis sp. YF1]UNU42677.1 glycosyltransferase family 1 protein [Sphingopyxis sp. YF1]